VYVASVAPGIALPSTSHWNRTLASGFQVPGVAVRGTPTCGVPVTVGGVRLSICLSTKWMNPVGHPVPLLSLRQWKSPPQLSSEITISVGEITFSTYATWPEDPAPGTLAFHQATAPTRGCWSVISDISWPQWVALPPPDHGRTLGIPARTIR
jgi:hypothetical protein